MGREDDEALRQPQPVQRDVQNRALVVSGRSRGAYTSVHYQQQLVGEN